MDAVKHFFTQFMRNRLATVGLVMLIFAFGLSFLAPFLPLPDPNVTDLAARLKEPFSPGHFLGTDQLGRDILSRVLWGTRVSIAVGLVATAVASFIGSTIGLVAGYYGRMTDNILMRAIDMLMAFPYMLLALAIVAILGPGLMNALLAIAIVNIPFFARNVRGAVISLVRLDYVDAAKLGGLSNTRIILSELLPNVLPVIIITISTTIGWMILETAGLSFLGLGAQPPQADLGSMLGDGRKMVIIAPHVATIPGLVILFIVTGLNLAGDGLRDVLDPKLKSGALVSPAAKTAVADGAADKVEKSKDRDAVLVVDDLRTWFLIGKEKYKAVNDVGIKLKKGECLGVMGESGSGKSVTALSILGLVPTPPGKIMVGSIRFNEKELCGAGLNDLQKIRGNRIAYIFQNPLTTLNPLLKIGEQLAETVRMHQGVSNAEAMETAEKLLKDVQIPDAKGRLGAYPHELSGGMRQRVVIAMALANNPDIIIADEPTTALDVTIQAQILRLMNALREKYGLSVLFISHDFGVISEICDRVMVMYAGQVVETGTVQEIYESPLHPYTRRLLACVPRVGEPDQQVDAISGLPPAVNQLPVGCAFAQRCDIPSDECRQNDIQLFNMGPGRVARCLKSGGAA